MDFEEAVEKFSPGLRKIAQTSKARTTYIDKEDMVQQMLLHLWARWEMGDFDGKSYGYILQGCKYHLNNYLRQTREKFNLVSMDESIDGNGNKLKETISDDSPPFTLALGNRMIVREIRANGLTKREREVFDLWLRGYTTREMAEKLGVSHVRVFKIQESIKRKCRKTKKNRVNKNTNPLLI